MLCESRRRGLCRARRSWAARETGRRALQTMETNERLATLGRRAKADRLTRRAVTIYGRAKMAAT